MDPLTVLKTIWIQRLIAVPVLVLTLMSCGYVYLLAPRNYEASVTFALTTPDVPSEEGKKQVPELADLNSDNPYLRSPDSSLLTQVAIARLTDPAYVDGLREAGWVTDFTIAPVSNLGLGLVSITASSKSEAEAERTVAFLGEQFAEILRNAQRVNGADDAYHYETILVRGPGPAVEQFSSRLRAVIMVGIAGGLLLFAAVSIAQSVTLRRKPLAAGERTDGERSFVKDESGSETASPTGRGSATTMRSH